MGTASLSQVEALPPRFITLGTILAQRRGSTEWHCQGVTWPGHKEALDSPPGLFVEGLAWVGGGLGWLKGF